MIVAFQNPEFKILADFKILAFQNPEFKILADFKILAVQNTELKIFADFKIYTFTLYTNSRFLLTSRFYENEEMIVAVNAIYGIA